MLKTNFLGIDYAINTNGILLDRVLPIIGKTCAWTRISLDSGSRKAYKNIHQGKDFFDRIVKNTSNLVKIARGTVGVSFVVMKNGEKMNLGLLEYLKETPGEKISDRYFI